MRKRVFGRQLSRNKGSRRALFRALVRAMVVEGSVVTTLAKAKAVKPELERVMTLVKMDTLTARKRLMVRLGNDEETVKKLFDKYADLVKGRQSGFVKVVAMPLRMGDNAKMARIMWVEDGHTTRKATRGKEKENEDISAKA